MGKAGPGHRYSDDQLLAAIREIGEGVENPKALTQRQFDALRATCEVACPRAAAICSRFGVTWDQVKEAAFGEPARAFQHFRRTISPKSLFPADRRTCVEAVRLAAAQISSPTLLPRQYEKQRHLALRRVRGKARLQIEARWPPASQVTSFGWDEVVSEAGLAIRPDPERRTSMAVVDVMELFLECRGYVPKRKTIRDFANAYGISMAKDTGLTVSYLEELRARRDSGGLWTPESILTQSLCPDQTPEGATLEAERVAPFSEAHPLVRKGGWTEERILGGIDLAISKLRPGESLTQKRLRELAKENRGEIPSPTTVTEYASKHGTSLPELREQAIRSAGGRARHPGRRKT